MTTQTQQDESHICEHPGCTNIVPYDDEPFCFEHSSDTGSYVQGYSYKKKFQYPK